MSNIASTPHLDEELKATHAKLKEKLDTAQESQAWWEETVSNDEWKDLRRQMETEIQGEREELETAKGEDIKVLQSRISAKKSLLSEVEKLASPTRVLTARQRLREFEDKNALLLSADSTRSAIN